jgi:hypothetical protein
MIFPAKPLTYNSIPPTSQSIDPYMRIMTKLKEEKQCHSTL